MGNFTLFPLLQSTNFHKLRKPPCYFENSSALDFLFLVNNGYGFSAASKLWISLTHCWRSDKHLKCYTWNSHAARASMYSDTHSTSKIFLKSCLADLARCWAADIPQLGGLIIDLAGVHLFIHACLRGEFRNPYLLRNR
jgi:hypothetical protein